jgi:hypothetical protein
MYLHSPYLQKERREKKKVEKGKMKTSNTRKKNWNPIDKRDGLEYTRLALEERQL